VVISDPLDDTTGTNAGAAYVFSVNGTLLATLNNPGPTPDDSFGSQLAAFGSEGVIIAAPGDDAGATDAGSVYLFSIPAPPGVPVLTIQRTTTNAVAISWPSPSTGFSLQQNTNGLSSINWSNVTAAIQDNGTSKTLLVNPTNGSGFYRLVSP
jgi:hypothetical protein